MASAVHVGGRRLYELARQGAEIQVPPRTVHIYALELREFIPASPPRAMLHAACSNTTYIRRLCSDESDAVGCAAYASFMVRMIVGRYEVASAATLEKIQTLAVWDPLR